MLNLRRTRFALAQKLLRTHRIRIEFARSIYSASNSASIRTIRPWASQQGEEEVVEIVVDSEVEGEELLEEVEEGQKASSGQASMLGIIY